MLYLANGVAKTATQAQRGPYKTLATTAVKRLRLARFLTQSQAAKFCGLSLRTYQRVESGDCRDRSTVRTAERAFGLFF